jgi:hypothetical protein
LFTAFLRGADKRKNPICKMGSGGPNFLAVNDVMIALAPGSST